MPSHDRICVGFFDMLGFKAFVEAKSLSELVKIYESIDRQTAVASPKLKLGKDQANIFPTHPAGKPLCDRTMISDTIILTPHSKSGEDCLKLLLSAWRLMQVFIASGLPLRGAIYCHELHFDLKSRQFIGRALTRAYELEQQQEWAGAVIDDTVFYNYPHLHETIRRIPILEDVFPIYDVPFKSSRAKRFQELLGLTLGGPNKFALRRPMRVINWRFNFVSKEGTAALLPKPIDSKSDKKIKNTLAFAKWVKNRGRIYPTQPERIPPELQTFWVGNTEPPFAHGDNL